MEESRSLSLVGDKNALKDIVGSPGIAGDEDLGILKVFKKLVPAGIIAKIWPQRFATVEISPKNPTASLLVVAHADTNGLRVTKITDDGYLRFQVVGGVSSAHYLSSVVCIWSRLGKRIVKMPGVVGWKAFHNLDGTERNQAPDPKHLVIDIGCKEKAEVEALGIKMGDPVTFDNRITYLKNDIITANGLDNRSGVWCVIEALLKTCKEKLNLRTVFAISGKEEIGLVGAQQIEGLYDRFDFCIGIDVGFANDYPGAADSRSTGPDISLGKGPIIYRGSVLDRELVNLSIDLAKGKNLPHQIEFIGGSVGTDAMIFERKGVRTIHFGIPCRYMHFEEAVSLSDFKNTADLVAELIKKINGQ